MLTIPQINLPRYRYRLTQPHDNGDPTLKRLRETAGFESEKDSFLKIRGFFKKMTHYFYLRYVTIVGHY